MPGHQSYFEPRHDITNAEVEDYITDVVFALARASVVSNGVTQTSTSSKVRCWPSRSRELVAAPGTPPHMITFTEFRQRWDVRYPNDAASATGFTSCGF